MKISFEIKDLFYCKPFSAFGKESNCYMCNPLFILMSLLISGIALYNSDLSKFNLQYWQIGVAYILSNIIILGLIQTIFTVGDLLTSRIDFGYILLISILISFVPEQYHLFSFWLTEMLFELFIAGLIYYPIKYMYNNWNNKTVKESN